jgi:hypothetical protein
MYYIVEHVLAQHADITLLVSIRYVSISRVGLVHRPS